MSSKLPPASGSFVELTYARRVASTGVLQGEATKAKVRPARYACKNVSALLMEHILQTLSLAKMQLERIQELQSSRSSIKPAFCASVSPLIYVFLHIIRQIPIFIKEDLLASNAYLEQRWS